MLKHFCLLLISVLFTTPAIAQFIYPKTELAKKVPARMLLIEQISEEQFKEAPQEALDFMNGAISHGFRNYWTHSPVKMVSGAKVDEVIDKKNTDATVAALKIYPYTYVNNRHKAPAIVFELFLGEEKKSISKVALSYSAINYPDARFVARQFNLMLEAAIEGKSEQEFHDIDRKRDLLTNQELWVTPEQSKLDEEKAKERYQHPLKFVDQQTLEDTITRNPNAKILYLQPIVDLTANYNYVAIVDANTGRIAHNYYISKVAFTLGATLPFQQWKLDNALPGSRVTMYAVPLFTSRFGGKHLLNSNRWHVFNDLDRYYHDAFHVKP